MGHVDAVVLRSGALLAVAAAAAVAFAADWDSPVRTVLGLGFLLFVPGLAIAEMLAIRDPLNRLALATGASLAVETVAGLALLYAGAFSEGRTLAIVLAVTVGSIAVALRRHRRAAV
jgi:uncharacterized membrane protein